MLAGKQLSWRTQRNETAQLMSCTWTTCSIDTKQQLVGPNPCIYDTKFTRTQIKLYSSFTPSTGIIQHPAKIATCKPSTVPSIYPVRPIRPIPTLVSKWRPKLVSLNSRMSWRPSTCFSSSLSSRMIVFMSVTRLWKYQRRFIVKY